MNNAIPDKIIQKVSIFHSMPQAGIKLRALLTEGVGKKQEFGWKQ